MLQELTGNVERDRGAGAIAGDDVRSGRTKLANFPRQVRREILNGRKRCLTVFESRRLQAEKGLIVSEVLRQSTIKEDITIVAGHSENRRPLASRLQRDNRALLTGKKLGRTQEFDDVALALTQCVSQVRRQHTGGSVAPQWVTVNPDLNGAASQFREKRRHCHSAMSSRSPAPASTGEFAPATHDRPSMTSARPATVGRSKRLRRETSTPNASRIFDTARMARSDCAPSSKKSSWIPTLFTLSSC